MQKYISACTYINIISDEKTTTENLSALRENIERKGKNSYYYAHSTPINAPKWDGNEVS